MKVKVSDDGRKLIQDADKDLELFISGLEQEVSHHRMVTQENKCGYGLAGVCCKLCSNGPCRLSNARTRGVCGADADTIVMRNFLRSIAAGSGCYIHVVENGAKHLRKMAQNKDELPGKNSLKRLQNMLDIPEGPDWQVAADIAERILSDLSNPLEEKMPLVEKVAYPKRVENWRKLGVLPGGSKDEIMSALLKTSTNMNSDPLDMVMHSMRLGISTGIYGLVLANLIQDVMIGESEIRFEQVGLGVVNPDYINIMITGHQQHLFKEINDILNEPKIQNLAKDCGAKGIHLVGSTCVGQDFQVRKASCGETFCGHAGNNYTTEAILETGCIDMVLSEFNCTLPGIEEICERRQIPQICLDILGKKANAEYIPFVYERYGEIAGALITKALTSYKKRVASQHPRVNPMIEHGFPDAITGVTEQTLESFLGGSMQPLVDLIASGEIRGIAAVVGCSNLRGGGHDVHTVNLVKNLIRNNILVVAAGCTCGGLENCGLMSPSAADLAGESLKSVCKKLGIPPVLNFGPCLAIGRIEMTAAKIADILKVDLPDLPVVVSAPQWLEEQALADGVFALALGFPLHLGLTPFVTGSDKVLDILTDKMRELTGGMLICNSDMQESSNILTACIDEKRKKLGI